MGQDPSKGGDAYRKIENVYNKRGKRKQQKRITSAFRWCEGGKTVSVIGSFNNWREELPMQYDPDDGAFVAIISLPPGKHLFRYIVDDEFRTDSNFPVQKDSDGYYSNIVDLRDENISHPNLRDVRQGGQGGQGTGQGQEGGQGQAGQPDDGQVIDEQFDRPAASAPRAIPTSVPKKPVADATSTGAGASTGGAESSGTASGTTHVTSGVSGASASPSSVTSGGVKSRVETSRSRVPPSSSRRPPVPDAVERLRRLPQKPPRDMTFPKGFGQNEFRFPETRKTPPLLPPHLRFTPLRSRPAVGGTFTPEELCFDSSIMPLPLHVTLNRTYFSQCRRVNYRRDPVWVMGLTKASGPPDDRKYTTVKFYYDPTKISRVPGMRRPPSRLGVFDDDEGAPTPVVREIEPESPPPSPFRGIRPPKRVSPEGASSYAPEPVKRGGIYQAFRREAELSDD